MRSCEILCNIKRSMRHLERFSVVIRGNRIAKLVKLIQIMNVDEEIEKLKEEITKLGEKQADGSVKVKFGKLFDETGDIFEALGGTLRAAKKRKIISFAAEMLLQGRDNNVEIILLPQ
ncbi:unnamed protein product [Closterium sp. NIES-65]|nr:unnamed protein product [Closterium sp. NIES-65]